MFALLHYLHSVRSRRFPHTFTRDIINLRAGYGYCIIDVTTQLSDIADTEARIEKHDFKVLKQSLSR